MVWGIAVTIGYLGTYAFVRGWSPLHPNGLWALCIGLPWIYSLRRLLLPGFERDRDNRPMARAMGMLWFGYGVFLTTLGVAAMSTGDIRQGWFNAVVAGVSGTAFFASAGLSNIGWLRWVAVLWWLGELAVFALRHRPEVLLLSAALMLLLLAGPGLLLLLRLGRA
jgi:hypothetical protein